MIALSLSLSLSLSHSLFVHVCVDIERTVTPFPGTDLTRVKVCIAH
jgi:hypothetical protein